MSGSFSRNTSDNPPVEVKPSRHPPASPTDIGVFVSNHKKLVELLFPLNGTLNACLHIMRWKNYLLTSAVVCALCVFMYYPAIFLSCLTLVAIILMAIGMYYGQTKKSSILKTRETPSVNYLQEDVQILEDVHRHQKNSHALLIEYKKIIQKIEQYILIVSKFLEYLYRIILWKSPEVSLCITVLLCICFVLLSTIQLRVIAACVPILILCTNRHFLKRTVNLWKQVRSFLYKMVKLKPREVKELHSFITVPETVRERSTSELSEQLIVSTPQEPLEISASGNIRAMNNSLSESQEQSESASTVVISANSTEGDIASGRPHGATKGVPPVAEICTTCQASFIKLLKRRHLCSSCGQTFCGSCTVKVKRAMLGATSPAAFEESVRVCISCKTKLNNVT